MRKRNKAAVAAIGSLALIGCFTVHFDIDSGQIDLTLESDSFDIDPDCIDEDPGDRVSQTLVGDQCHLTVDCSDDIDMEEVRAAVNAEIGPDHTLDDLSELDFQTAILTINSIELVDGSGNPITGYTFTNGSASLDMGGAPLLDIEAANEAVLLATDYEIDLAEDLVEDFEVAFENSTPVPVGCQAEIVVPLAVLPIIVAGDHIETGMHIQLIGEGGAEAL